MSGMAAPRPTALVVASSACQMFSGTGTALFDWIQIARHSIEFSFLIDSAVSMSFGAAARFCRESGIEMIVSGPEYVPGCPDARPVAAASVLHSRHWDLIECISWANASTNLEVLCNRPPGSRLIFTPHTQPTWTLPDADRYYMVAPVFESMLNASDLILVDTPDELAHMPNTLIDERRVVFIPLGVDATRFRPTQGRRPPALPARVLSVADFREPRKRADLVLQALEVSARPTHRSRLFW